MKSSYANATRPVMYRMSHFPRSGPSSCLAARTFWEKATAVHVFCRQQRSRGERLSRHWYDLARLDDTGYANTALADSALALSVSAPQVYVLPGEGRGRGLG